MWLMIDDDKSAVPIMTRDMAKLALSICKLKYSFSKFKIKCSSTNEYKCKASVSNQIWGFTFQAYWNLNSLMELCNGNFMPHGSSNICERETASIDNVIMSRLSGF